MSEPDEAAEKCQHGVNPGFACNECSVVARHTVIVGEPDEEAVEAVARSINWADNEWADAPRTMPHEVWPVHVARAVLATPVVADAFRDAGRLRNLAARFEGHDDWDRSFLGEQIAAMLRGDGA